jgi:aminoglycoside phosphotransferase (APT) family kinase protein
VLRRYRRRDVPEREISVMRHAREHGFPVPEIFSVHGPDVVMERAPGPTMTEAALADPSEIDRYARTLAALHERLHAIDAPAGIPAVGPGDALLHLDLHPDNVLVTTRGPVVIDWANAARGHWADDVAQTVVILGGVIAEARVLALVAHFVERFLASFDREAVRAHLDAAIERRARDPNLTAEEIAAARAVRV